jgi:hypothetical protein
MTSERTVTVTLRVRGRGADDYGVARVVIPCSDIDWSLADGPSDRVDIDDIYQVDLEVERPDGVSQTDTWDRA